MSVHKDQRVIITAAADGLGKVVAEMFMAEGAKVALCDIQADKVAAMAKAHPGHLAEVCDVGDAGQVASFMARALKHLGGVDILINNAGIAGPTGTVEEVTPEGLRQCLAICLEAMFHTCRAAVPVMKAQKSGLIVNLSSTAGLFGYPYRTPYAAAKWGVEGLTKSLAIELGRFGIRANTLCPGSLTGDRMNRVIAAEAKAKGLSEEAVRQSLYKGVSLSCFIEPEEIGAMILYLASPAGKKITGQSLAVDGGTETLSP